MAHKKSRKSKARKTRKVYGFGRKASRKVKRHGKRHVMHAAARRRVYKGRRRSNPRAVLGSPAVEIGLSALAGVGLGLAADARPKFGFLTTVPSLRNSHLIGLGTALVGWKFAKGAWRQRLIAAGIGAAGQAIARDQIAPLFSKVPGLTPAASTALPRGNSNLRYLSGRSSGMQSPTDRVLAANGLIR